VVGDQSVEEMPQRRRCWLRVAMLVVLASSAKYSPRYQGAICASPPPPCFSIQARNSFKA
jgi:hypothetical protein